MNDYLYTYLCASIVHSLMTVHNQCHNKWEITCIVESVWELVSSGMRVKPLSSLQMGPFVDATHKLVKVSTRKLLLIV